MKLYVGIGMYILIPTTYYIATFIIWPLSMFLFIRNAGICIVLSIACKYVYTYTLKVAAALRTTKRKSTSNTQHKLTLSAAKHTEKS